MRFYEHIFMKEECYQKCSVMMTKIAKWCGYYYNRQISFCLNHKNIAIEFCLRSHRPAYCLAITRTIWFEGGLRDISTFQYIHKWNAQAQSPFAILVFYKSIFFVFIYYWYFFYVHSFSINWSNLLKMQICKKFSFFRKSALLQ